MKPGRSRNSKRMVLRDRALVARFYYWTEIQRRRFDDVISILEFNEFFITEQSIKDALDVQEDYLNELMRKKPAVATLKLKYPSWAWSKNTNIVVKLK